MSSDKLLLPRWLLERLATLPGGLGGLPARELREAFWRELPGCRAAARWAMASFKGRSRPSQAAQQVRRQFSSSERRPSLRLDSWVHKGRAVDAVSPYARKRSSSKGRLVRESRGSQRRGGHTRIRRSTKRSSSPFPFTFFFLAAVSLSRSSSAASAAFWLARSVRSFSSSFKGGTGDLPYGCSHTSA